MPTPSGRMTADERRERDRLRTIAQHDQWAREIDEARPGWSDDRAREMLDAIERSATGETQTLMFADEREPWAVCRALERSPHYDELVYFTGSKMSFGIGAPASSTRYGVSLHLRHEAAGRRVAARAQAR